MTAFMVHAIDSGGFGRLTKELPLPVLLRGIKVRPLWRVAPSHCSNSLAVPHLHPSVLHPDPTHHKSEHRIPSLAHHRQSASSFQPSSLSIHCRKCHHRPLRMLCLTFPVLSGKCATSDAEVLMAES